MAKSLRPMNAVLPEGKPVTEVTSGLIERWSDSALGRGGVGEPTRIGYLGV